MERPPAPSYLWSRVDPDDRQLVDDARRGNQAAFRALVMRYQRRIYALGLSMLHDPDAAQDVVQDAFIKAHTHLPDFQGGSSFYTWLYRIALNLCLDRLRRAKRAAHEEFDETVAHAADDAFAVAPRRLGFDPAQALRDGEIRRRVLDALARLSENHRAVLVMAEMDGMSYQEMADVMGCPVGTIMSRLFHARKKMQEMLRPFVEEEGDRAPRAGATGSGGAR